MNPFPIVIASLKRNWTISALFTALIAFAVGLGIAISAQERALRKGSAVAAERFDLLVGAPGSPTDLVLNVIYLRPGSAGLMPGPVWAPLLGAERTRLVAPLAFGDSYKHAPIIGTTAEFVAHLTGGLLGGRMFATISEVVIGSQVDLEVGAEFSPTHGQIEIPGVDEHEGVAFKVVGRLLPTGTPWDSAIVVPVEAIWATHGLATGHKPASGDDTEPIGPPFDVAYLPPVPAVVVKPESIAAAYGLRNAYRADQTMAFFPAEVLVEIYAVLGDARKIMGYMSIATQVLVILAILAGVMSQMRLFGRQFAVLRALGAPKLYVFAVVWCYVALIILGGTGLGVGLGWAMAKVVSVLFAEATGIALVVSLGKTEYTLAVAIAVIGMFLAVLPARILYSRPVVKGLSGV